jgi:succinoglycan biosynthesis transport protein ExoP
MNTLLSHQSSLAQPAGASWLVPGRSPDPITSLRAHWGLAVCVASLVLTLGLVVALTLGRSKYYTEAVIRVSPRSPSSQQGVAWSTYAYVPDYRNFLQQQVFEISNYAITSEALKRLGRKRSLWQKAGESDRHAAERLLWSLKVQTVPDTYLISVGLEDTRPDGLADITNAVVASYLSHEQDQELSGTGQGLQLLNKQKTEIQEQIDVERVQQSKLARELGVSGFETGLTDPFTKSLVDANEALERSRRDLISAKAHLASVQEQQNRVRNFDIESATDQMVLMNPDANAAKTGLIQKREADFLQLQGLGPKHPGRLALESEINKINRELTRIDGTTRDQIRWILLENRAAKARVAFSEAEARVDQAQRVQNETEKEVAALRDKVASTSARRSLALALHESIENQAEQIKNIDDEIRSTRLQAQSPGFAALASPASTPDAPEKGKRKTILGLFGIMAVVLGVLAATGVDLLDPKIKKPGELQAILGFTPLGVAVDGDNRLAQEALTRIALGIVRERRATGVRTYVLTSVRSKAGTTSLAFALGRTLNELGTHTIVVEANAVSPDDRYRSPHLHIGSLNRKNGHTTRPFNPLATTNSSNGKDHWIAEANDSLPSRISICRHDGAPRCSMACAQSLVDLSLANYDLVLVDAPPLLDSSAAAMVIQMPAGAILIVRAGRDTKDEIEAVARELEKLSPSVVGTIMNCAASDNEATIHQAADTMDNLTERPFGRISPTESL